MAQIAPLNHRQNHSLNHKPPFVLISWRKFPHFLAFQSKFLITGLTARWLANDFRFFIFPASNLKNSHCRSAFQILFSSAKFHFLRLFSHLCLKYSKNMWKIVKILIFKFIFLLNYDEFVKTWRAHSIFREKMRPHWTLDASIPPFLFHV